MNTEGCLACLLFFFFFQAEDGIRDWSVTGVQTCARPICLASRRGDGRGAGTRRRSRDRGARRRGGSEERRVGKECRSRWSPYHKKKNASLLIDPYDMAPDLKRFMIASTDSTSSIGTGWSAGFRSIFFFRAENGIRGWSVTGVQTCALPILVERTTRFTILLHLPRMAGHGDGPRTKNGPALAGHGAEAVRDAITRAITTLPEQLRRSLTWDQGAELSQHAQL